MAIEPETQSSSACGSLSSGRPEPEASPTAKKRILLADDSPQIRVSLSKLLRNAGYQVSPVANGNEVLERTLEEDFDLLIMDLNMPGLDGWQTLEQLSKLGSTLPVLIITAQPGQREWAEAEGALVSMEKPLDLPVLLETMAQMMARPRSGPNRPSLDRSALRFQNQETPVFSFSEPQRRWARG
jgi:CheY-like chemotaxis protein